MRPAKTNGVPAILTATLLLLTFGLARAEDEAPITGEVTKVDDGSRFSIGTNDFRLWGIDAPESGDAGEEDAQKFLSGLILDKTVTCNMKRETANRIIAQCFTADGKDLSCAVAWAGFARDWPKYSEGYYAKCDRMAVIWREHADDAPPPF